MTHLPRIRQRIGELLARAHKREQWAYALRAEGYEELAFTEERSAARLRRKVRAAWSKMTFGRMSANQQDQTQG